MIKIDMPIIVEGKYDKIKLKSIVDGIVITTDGFGIYKNKEKISLIRAFAHKTGVIILTDSDGAGFQIRNHLKSCIGGGKIINIYIPDVFGKERRKEKPSAEGKLGVEGIDPEILRKAFIEAGVLSESPTAPKEKWLTKADMLDDGLIGKNNSAALRKQLCKALGLPERLSSEGLSEALNSLYDREQYEKALLEISRKEQ
ncbi:MAG: toprim domain-containing protein [Ruminiclostridium sp.]